MGFGLFSIEFGHVFGLFLKYICAGKRKNTWQPWSSVLAVTSSRSSTRGIGIICCYHIEFAVINTKTVGAVFLFDENNAR